MLKTGMIIAERYEILGKIGTGGMADVYKAKDHKLNRFVAVKVLKQEFSENANFVSKFKTEAQAAADQGAAALHRRHVADAVTKAHRADVPMATWPDA